MKRKKFDNIATTRRNTLVTALAPASIALFLSAAIVPYAASLALALMACYFIAQAQFWNFIFKNSGGNPPFCLYLLARTFLIASIDTLGAGLGLIGQVPHRIAGNGFIIQFIKSYFCACPNILLYFAENER